MSDLKERIRERVAEKRADIGDETVDEILSILDEVEDITTISGINCMILKNSLYDEPDLYNELFGDDYGYNLDDNKNPFGV